MAWWILVLWVGFMVFWVGLNLGFSGMADLTSDLGLGLEGCLVAWC